MTAPLPSMVIAEAMAGRALGPYQELLAAAKV